MTPGNNAAAAHTPIRLTAGEAVTTGVTNVLDITGAPILSFEVDTPSTIVAQGRITLQYAAL